MTLEKACLLLLARLMDSFAFSITFIVPCLISPFPSSLSDEREMTKREICCRLCYFCPAGLSEGLHGKAEFPSSLTEAPASRRQRTEGFHQASSPSQIFHSLLGSNA